MCRKQASKQASNLRGGLLSVVSLRWSYDGKTQYLTRGDGQNVHLFGECARSREKIQDPTTTSMVRIDDPNATELDLQDYSLPGCTTTTWSVRQCITSWLIAFCDC